MDIFDLSNCQMSNPSYRTYNSFTLNTKGQLISRAFFLVLIWSKKWTKLFFEFCSKAKLLLLKIIQLFSRKVLLVKKLDIKETKTNKNSTFEINTIKVGLVSLISNFFITKTSLANKWIRKKIHSCSNWALASKMSQIKKVKAHY